MLLSFDSLGRPLVFHGRGTLQAPAIESNSVLLPYLASDNLKLGVQWQLIAAVYGGSLGNPVSFISLLPAPDTATATSFRYRQLMHLFSKFKFWPTCPSASMLKLVLLLYGATQLYVNAG